MRQDYQLARWEICVPGCRESDPYEFVRFMHRAIQEQGSLKNYRAAVLNELVEMRKVLRLIDAAVTV